MFEKFSGNDQLKRRSEITYIQSLVRIDKQIKGWGDSFTFCTDTLYRHQLDTELNEIIKKYRDKFFKKINFLSMDKQRRMFGITLLKDIELKDCTSTRHKTTQE